MRYYGEFEHKAFAFSSMTDEISVPFFDDPLKLIKEGRGSIYLPKFSINTIVLKDSILIPQGEVDTCYKVSFNMGNGKVDILTEGYPAFIPNLPNEPMQADSTFNFWITAAGERFDANYLVVEDMEVFPTWQIKSFVLNVVSPNGGIIYEPQQATYEIHSEVTLTAKPHSNYEFLNWTGDVQSTDTTITIVMDSAINLTANYRHLPTYRLDVYFSKGEVNKFPNSSRYILGFTVELTATPASGYQFDSWSGDYIGTENPLYLTMKEDMEIYANFVLKTTAIEAVDKSVIKVFPNPNDGVFMVQLDGKLTADYTLYNIAGVKIQSGKVESNREIELIDKKPGIYLLKLSSAKESKMIKVIVR
jgi:hypothetical protein